MKFIRCLVLLVCVGVSLLWASETEMQDIFPTEKLGGDIYVDPGSQREKCFAGNLLSDSGTLPSIAVEGLTPGFYRVKFNLRVSHTVSPYISRMVFNLKALQGDKQLAESSMRMIAFETPGQYQEFELPFIVTKTGLVTFQVGFSWDEIRDEKRPFPKDEVELGNVTFSDIGNRDEVLELEKKLSDLPWHITLDRIRILPAIPVSVRNVAVDKIRYKPGEKVEITAEIKNHSDESRKVNVITELVRNLNDVCEVKREEFSLKPATAVPLSVSSKLTEALWGHEVRIRVLEGDTELHQASEYFTVHTNHWAVAVGSYGINLSYYRAGKKGEKAAGHAQLLKKNYANTVEFVFWAEDDFGNLVPEDTPFWSGQMRHQGGAESTRQLIDAFHKVGVACSFYSLYIVADGKSGYELYRENPNWFRPQFYDVSHLDRWDRSTELTSWPRLSVRSDTAEPYRHHADEIIRSVKAFGWDSIRYDTDMTVKEMAGTQHHIAKYFPATKSRVNKILPEFQWGYNDALHRTNLENNPELSQLFETICSGGGMIMDEYNNHAFQDRWTYEKYAGRHRFIRQQVHPKGGHVTFCPFDLMYDNDKVYQAILPLAARAHHAWDPDKGNFHYANYQQFSTRYAGALWDTNAIQVPDAAERIIWKDDTKNLFRPNDYSYLRPRGKDRTDLIIHLINRPPERAASYKDGRVNLPVTNLECEVKLPAGTIVRGVYAASAEPSIQQIKVPHTLTGEKLTFIIPKLRFWTMVVIELEGEGDWK